MKKIVAVIIAGTVSALIFGALLPVWADTTASEDTFTNEGYYSMDKVTDETETVISWSISAPNIVNIGSKTMDMSTLPSKSFTLLGSDSLIIRYYNNGSDIFMQAFGAYYMSLISNSQSATTFTATVSGGSVDIVIDSTPEISNTYSIGTDCYIANPDNTGDYSVVMKKADVSAYVNGDSKIVLMGNSITDYSSAIALYATGTLNDGLTFTTLYKPSNVTTVTYSDPVVTYSEVDNHKDLYTLDKYQFNIIRDGSPTAVTYSYFVVPNEVTAERTVHMSGALATLVNIIPLLIAFGLIIGIAGVVIYKRM